jgi:hypothetical protein
MISIICHSERSEESPAFIEFLTQRIKFLYDLKNFANFFCQKVKIGGINV